MTPQRVARRVKVLDGVADAGRGRLFSTEIVHRGPARGNAEASVLVT